MRIQSGPRLVLGCVLLAAGLAGCSTVPMTGRSQLALVSSQELSVMAADQYQTLLADSKLSTDAEAVARVRRCGARIQAAAEAFMRDQDRGGEMAHYAWEFNLIQDDETVNAFCMPGGKIAVYTGLLPVARDEAGLAAVVGHEVAHALAGHGAERMSQLLLVELGGQALQAALQEKPEQTQRLFFAAYGLGAQYGFMLPYSRKHEYEADRIGLLLMARAGYDPREALAFWERMGAGDGARPPEFLSTHPAPENRIEALRGLLDEALKEYHP